MAKGSIVNAETLESLGLTRDEIDALSEKEIRYLLTCVQEYVTTGTSPAAQSLVLEDYKWQPVSMQQFLDDPFYMGSKELTGSLYPVLRDMLIDCFDKASRRPIEVAMGGALGWGKSTGAAIILLYLIYRLTCLRDPHSYYGLMPGAPIYIGIYSISLEQALDTTYGKLLRWIDSIPYFNQRCPRVKRINSVIRFSSSPVEVLAGSKEVHTIGRDMFAFFLDEANFMTTPGGAVDDGVAYGIYNNAVNRLKTRFMTTHGEPAGMAIIASSKRTKVSFLETHVKESANELATGAMRYYAYAQWDAKPAALFRMPKFRVEIGDRIYPSRILHEGEDPRPGSDVITVPGEFRGQFDADIDKALRDLAGVATESLMPLFHDKSVIHAACTAEHSHPFTRQELSIDIRDDIGIEAYFRPELMFRTVRSRYEMRLNPGAGRYLHIDVGLTQDSLGLVMLHPSGIKTVTRARKDGTFYDERAPLVTVDFMLRIRPPKGSEIDLGKVRSFVQSLRDYGVPIWRVTCDSFQSRDMVQVFKKLGFSSEIYSVDKNDEAYMSVRQAFIEKRISFYRYDTVIRELSELERDIDTRKVDHPKLSPSTGQPGSKDVADGLAAAYFMAMNDKRVAASGVPLRGSEDNVSVRVAVPGGSMLWADLDKEVAR